MVGDVVDEKDGLAGRQKTIVRQLPTKKMIGLLGSDLFAQREMAHRELAKVGKPALPFLRKLKDHPDLEVRWRANRIRSGLEVQVSSYPPIKIHLVRTGEDLASIASSYDLSAKLLSKYNSLGDTGASAGEMLAIPVK